MKKKAFIIAAFIFLFLSGSVIFYLVKESQDPRSRAEANATILQFSPASSTISIGAEFPVNITLDSKSNNITGVDITLKIDPTLEFVSFTPSSTFNSQLINTYEPSTSTLRVAAVNTSSSTITSIITLGSLKIKGRSLGSGNLQFTKAQITSFGQDLATPVNFSEIATYTVAEISKLYFNPEMNTANTDTELTTSLMLDAKANNITGIDITFAIPPTLDFIEFTPTATFNSILINSYNPTLQRYRFAAVNTSSNSITGIIKIGDFKLKGNTQSTSAVTISNQQVTSSGNSNPALVDTSFSATYIITGAGTNPSPSITSIPTPAPTRSPDAIDLTFTIFLHSIGKFGDTVNPTSFKYSNANPLNPGKPIQVELISANSPTITKYGTITFDSLEGNFKGQVILDPVPSKTYQIKIKSPQYLRKDLGLHLVGPGTSLNFPTFDFVTGDINNDNKLDVLDYNLLLTCYSSVPNEACTSINRTLADLNDDGKVDTTDYNLFFRESSVRNGE